MRGRAVTLALLGAALVVDAASPRVDADRAAAERLIGPADPLRLPGPAAFRAGTRVALVFETRGLEGRIRGIVVVEGGAIRDLVLLESREGPNRTALDDPRFARAFRGLASVPPVVVDAVSGATVSSQAVVDAVNERLKALAAWAR